MKRRSCKWGRMLGQWGYEHGKWNKRLLSLKASVDELKTLFDTGKKRR